MHLPTTISRPDGRETILTDVPPAGHAPDELRERYRAIQRERSLAWTEHHLLLRKLGSGGQGVVFLAHRVGADGFHLPVSLKIFSPENYENAGEYEHAMVRMARVAARVALIQQDHLIDVHNFAVRDGLRVMEMEWVDGYDLGRLLTPALLDRARERVDERRWAYLNDVVVTAGAVQPRLKPGIAIAVLRDILAALSALHREDVVHSDVKPSNVMVKRTGSAKLIDIGSAFGREEPDAPRGCTPAYAAPEVLEGSDAVPQSDLASLGYVLIEMLSGAPPFAGLTRFDDLIAAKRALVRRLNDVLPEDVTRNDLLMGLIRGLIDPDPSRRFPDAEAADLVEQGAANFQRQLVRGDLASEYDTEIRAWLEELE